MKLIVGLGNPGKEYENTHHNMGFIMLDNYAKNHDIILNKNKFDGIYGESIINDEKVIFLKPQLYMNLSGVVVKKFVNYYKIDIKDILIIHDDLDMPIGKIKLKYKGSSGGHNGIKNIIENINTEEFKRLKLGISRGSIAVKDYVLSKFTSEELVKINKLKDITNNLLDDYFKLNYDVLMSKYNGEK